MRNETIPQTVLFPDLFDTPLVATFDQPHSSSDGGAVLLKAAEARYALIDGFARCLVEDRQPGKVRHTLADLLAQRIYGLACGHPDANDADRLADDPIHKLLLGRDPVDGDPIASQPTISRFENGVGPRVLNAMGRLFMDPLDCPFRLSAVELAKHKLGSSVAAIVVDYHAEATSEKMAFPDDQRQHAQGRDGPAARHRRLAAGARDRAHYRADPAGG